MAFDLSSRRMHEGGKLRGGKKEKSRAFPSTTTAAVVGGRRNVLVEQTFVSYVCPFDGFFPTKTGGAGFVGTLDEEVRLIIGV